LNLVVNKIMRKKERRFDRGAEGETCRVAMSFLKCKKQKNDVRDKN